MALSFEISSPEDLYEITHQACEETEVYKGKTTPKSALEGLKKHDCYAVIKDNKIIGSVLFAGNVGHICVIKEHYKTWCGRQFYRFMSEQVKKRGVIQVTSGNPDSLRFIEMLEKRGLVCLVGKKY